MARGGKRDGAGRPANPTKQVRVPVAAADVARQLAELYLDRAWEQLRIDRWYKSAPEGSDISLTLTGIQCKSASELPDLPLNTDMGQMRTVIVCVARDATIDEEVEIFIEI